MTAVKHQLCHAWLMACRKVARFHGDPLDIGLTVLDNGDDYFLIEHPCAPGDRARVVWEGHACCRYEARAHAIEVLGHWNAEPIPADPSIIELEAVPE